VRRFSRVLVGAAGALLIVPLVVAAQALPASAATGKLWVTTVARDGQDVSSQVTVVNTNHVSPPLFGGTGRDITVPDGQYAVLAGIRDSTSGTLAGAIVTVSGSGTTKVTLDGRKGKPVKVTLNGRQVTGSGDEQICALDGFAFASVSAASNALYVVPNSSKYFNFAYLAEGSGAILSGQTSSGVPAGLTAHWSTSQLAKVSATVRSGEQLGSSTDYSIQGNDVPGASGMSCQTFLYGGIVSGTVGPYAATELVSPGYWVVEAGSDHGFYYMPEHFVAGQSYHYTLYGAVWAPQGAPSVGGGSIIFYAPTMADAGGNGDQSGLKNALVLSRNGRMVAKGTVSDVSSPADQFITSIKTSGWYTLTDRATRYDPGVTFPATLLSPEVDFAWRFYASPGHPPASEGFWTSLTPAGLNLDNQATPGSTTTIAVRPKQAGYGGSPAEPVSKVQAWWSGDGVHWSALAVSHGSGYWSVKVHNPAKGYVYLRTEVTGSHGDTSTETVAKAYAVS
jgi:hypothetical protein